jgi:hypothetical protein
MVDVDSYAEYQAKKDAASAGGAASASGDGSGEGEIAGRFGLTAHQPGLRSPDAIDTPRNVLNITSSSNVSTLPPEQMAQLQAQLIAAGYTSSTYKPTGRLDEETRKALLELKADSTGSQMSDLDTLRERLEIRAQYEAGTLGGSSGSSGGSAAAPVDNSPAVSVNKTITDPVFTDPMTARTIVRQAVEARLGRAPTSEEYHRFNKLLRNSEGGQDVVTQRSVTKPGETDNDSISTQRISRSDDTTDPSADVIADDMTRRGKLGREANTVTAATFMDVIARRVGM